MDLTLDNNLKTNITNDKEVANFIKELENSLNKNVYKTTLNTEILNEISLASKYKDILDDIVINYMKELSYENDFLYFDYDKNKESYYFDYYLQGETERAYVSKDYIKGMENKKGTIWEFIDDDKIVESEDLKDNIKINVEGELDLLDFKKKECKNGE